MILYHHSFFVNFKVGEELKEVVYATATDLVKLPYGDLAEGFYVVGTGSTGVASSLAVIAGIYATTCVAASFALKRPAPGYIPQGYTPPPGDAG